MVHSVHRLCLSLFGFLDEVTSALMRPVALYPPVFPPSLRRPKPFHLGPLKPPTCHSATVFPLFLWRCLAITGRAVHNIDQAFCHWFGRAGVWDAFRP